MDDDDDDDKKNQLIQAFFITICRKYNAASWLLAFLLVFIHAITDPSSVSPQKKRGRKGGKKAKDIEGLATPTNSRLPLQPHN